MTVIFLMITVLISIFWVRGIDAMKRNHPNYTGKDLFDDL